MKKSDLGDAVVHYIPQMWNDMTGKWIDVEPFKKPYTTKSGATDAIGWRRKGEKFRIRIETFKVTDVTYEDA